MTSRSWLAALLLVIPLAAVASPKTEAREYYLQALESAEQGEYRVAIGQFLASYDRYPHPATAWNVAKAYEDDGDLDRALFWLKRFQKLVPHRAQEAAPDIARVLEKREPLTAEVVEAVEVAPTSKPPPETTAKQDKPSMSDVLRHLEATSQD